MTSNGRVFVDNFASADHLKGRKRTYETVKTAVLEAGRFSIFEACESQRNARLFGRLMKDPELEHWLMGFPWTGIRRKVVANPTPKEANDGPVS